jgi:hypothetical protein
MTGAINCGFNTGFMSVRGSSPEAGDQSPVRGRFRLPPP